MCLSGTTARKKANNGVAQPSEGWASSALDLIRRVLVAAYEDNVFFLASALTFDALVAALPFVLLTLGVLGYVVQSNADAISSVHAILDRFLPLHTGARDPLAPAEQALVVAAESRRQLSAFGIPLFLWFSTRFFGAVRAAVNEVFDTEETRPWMFGKVVDLALVLASLVVLVLSTVLGLVLGTAVWPQRMLRRLANFLLGGVLFYAIYTIAPGRGVRPRTAVVAASVASLAFELARFLYGYYLAEFATADRLFSNANVIGAGLFLVWMYYTAVVFLIGGEVADTYDLMRRRREQRAILR
jgi:membrane protein